MKWRGEGDGVSGERNVEQRCNSVRAHNEGEDAVTAETELAPFSLRWHHVVRLQAPNRSGVTVVISDSRLETRDTRQETRSRLC